MMILCKFGCDHRYFTRFCHSFSVGKFNRNLQKIMMMMMIMMMMVMMIMMMMMMVMMMMIMVKMMIIIIMIIIIKVMEMKIMIIMMMTMRNMMRGNQSFIKQLLKSHQKDLYDAEAITWCKKELKGFKYAEHLKWLLSSFVLRLCVVSLWLIVVFHLITSTSQF